MKFTASPTLFIHEILFVEKNFRERIHFVGLELLGSDLSGFRH